MQDPGEYLRWAREQEPVFWSPRLGYWVVTRYDDVKAVFRDNLLFSPAIALEKITPATEEVMQVLQSYGFAMNRTMVNEDEPDHMARRRLLMDAFLPERLMAFEPMVRSLTKQYMDRFIDKGRVDLVREMFKEIPLTIALKFLGVADEDAEQLRQFAVAHTLNTWGRPTAQEQVKIAHKVGRFWQTAQNILDRMMAQDDGEGWMYESIRQHRLYPAEVPESYLRSMMMAILAAAHETTSNATANAFLTLLTHRQAWEDICANPALIPNAVEECLRVAGSIIAWRRITTADAVVGGVVIPKGSKLLIVQASANFDAHHFDNPEAVDVYREDAIEHLTFGYGAHQCMGKNIGRMQMRVFLEEFTRRLPHLELVPDQNIEYLSNTSFRGPSALWVQWDVHRTVTTPAQNSAFYIGPPSKDSMSRTVCVIEKHVEGDGLVRLVLADPQSKTLPAWRAGAHVDLIAGGFRRKYSLCGPSTERHSYQVVIQRDAQGRGGSLYFCDHVQPGDRLQLSGPKNHFKLDEDAQRYVLIAAGIGITPLVAMAERLRALGKPYVVHYAGRRRAAMALLDRLAEHPLQLYVKDEGQTLHLPDVLVQIDGNTRVYACGPQRLLDELASLSTHWPDGVLHVEHFSGRGAILDPSTSEAFEVQLKDSGLNLTVPPDQTLLQALQAAGVDVPCDCNEGLCGTCEVSVLEGQIEHRDRVLSASERATHTRMMACCSRAITQKIVLAL